MAVLPQRWLSREVSFYNARFQEHGILVIEESRKYTGRRPGAAAAPHLK
jgi:hypothetical protein